MEAADPQLAPVAQALLLAIEKRGLMDLRNRRRLARLLAQAGIADLAGLLAALDRGWPDPASARHLRPLLPPSGQPVVGGMPLLAHLAEGGMGSVWLAERDGGLVVVKTVRRELAADAATRRRFRREAALTTRFEHPNIVRCLAWGGDTRTGLHLESLPPPVPGGEVLWMALEFVAGGDVRRLLAAGALPEDEALAVLIQAARGLAHAHATGLVHRDIKPANLFVTGEGTVKIGDFGLARPVVLGEGDSVITAGGGGGLGSPPYIAPEQIRSAAVDHRADLYACGCVLFHAVSGSPPFRGAGGLVFEQHLSRPAPDLRLRCPAVSDRTAAIVARLLRKDPAERFPDADALVAALGEALTALGHETAGSLAAATVMRSAYESGAARRRIEIVDDPADPLFPPEPEPELAYGSTAPLPTVLPRRLPDPSALAGAIAGRRLTLAGCTWLVALTAGETLTAGKLRGESIELCLRDYPVAEHQESCQRVSREHWRLAWDARSRITTVCDLGSSNGTWLDGRQLEARRPHTLVEGRWHRLEIPRSVAVEIRPVARAGAVELAGEAGCDAIALRRPANRRGLAYALVIRRLSIGPLDADLPLDGWNGPPVEVAPRGGAWIARTGDGEWQPLRPADVLVGLVARTGSSDDLR
jgi:hypothetical protein